MDLVLFLSLPFILTLQKNDDYIVVCFNWCIIWGPVFNLEVEGNVTIILTRD